MALALLATLLSAAPVFAQSTHAGDAAAVPAGRLVRPNPRSAEYLLNWGIEAIEASAAYRVGATGKNVTVALLDTGVAAAQADLVGNISVKSTDVVVGRSEPGGGGSHGVLTASLLAARLDGTGSFGVAYEASVLSIRVDSPGSCLKKCRINGANIARGIDYALSQGARIIAMPLEAPRKLTEIEPALARAAAAGALVIAAAGNHGGDRPSWPAFYAADPRFAVTIVVAGASTSKGRPARWASKAAGAEQRFLLAPGERLPADCSMRRCAAVSGTSFAVSYVAGAAALLLERYPELRGPELARLLLDSAVDVGEEGADPVSGRGLLNVARAMRLANTEFAGAAVRSGQDRS